MSYTFNVLEMFHLNHEILCSDYKKSPPYIAVSTHLSVEISPRHIKGSKLMRNVSKTYFKGNNGIKIFLRKASHRTVCVCVCIK